MSYLSSEEELAAVLGHEIGQGMVKPIQAKVEAITKFPIPTGKREVRSFLGMVNYYRRYCTNFAKVAEPLTNALREGQRFHWTKACQEAFEELKGLLSRAPVLLTPILTKAFSLATDASDMSVGAVLMQTDEQDLEHPIAYMSKKLNKHQKNYSVIEKETLALVTALDHFDVYLKATPYPIQVYTDHNPLVFLHRMKNKNQRLTRWSLALQEYPLQIQHIKGKDNIIADGLSRIG